LLGAGQESGPALELHGREHGAVVGRNGSRIGAKDPPTTPSQ
jgi:hypothetical protein